MKNLIYFFSKPSLRYRLTKNLITFLTIILIILTQQGCNTTEPTLEPELKLELEDVSCTEAWIKLTTNNIQLPATINLLKNNSISQVYVLNTQDSLLYIDSLLPNQNYSFQVSHIVAGSIQHPVSSIVSNKVAATTLDTTSHNFTWQTFTFGQHSSSTLYDVAIINENDIWAVGEIYMLDSLGRPDPVCYNAIHWDGQKWELIKMGGYGGYPRRTVFAFSENNVWFDGVIKWDGSKYTVHMNGWPLLPNGDNWQVNKMWGSSSEDLYAVGNNGNIAHWDGKKWTKIESGTNSNIVDISGVQNAEGKYTKYCAADNLLLKIDGDNNLTSVAVNQGMFLNSVWAASNRLIYTAGNGIVLYKNAKWQKIDSPDINTIYGINGQSINDIVGLSANLSIFHFNGYSWNSNQTGTNNIYLKVQNKNNIIATVGWQNDRAIITILFRK